MAHLNIHQEKSAKQSVELDVGKTVRIGRAAENEVVLDDPRSSRVHAIVSASGGGWIVTDMDSRNGTKVNGKSVREATLKPGDRIEIGRAVIEFHDEAAERGRDRREARAAPAVAANAEFSDADFQREPAAATAKPRTSGMQNVLVLLAILVAVAGFLLVQASKPAHEPLPPMSLPSTDAVGAIPNGDTSHAVNATFVYTAPPQPSKALELRYKAYDIDKADEVRVYLNGQPILALQPTGDGSWSSERVHELPVELLKPGEKNYLVFQHAHNQVDQPASYAWGVSDVDIVPAVEVKCDAELAEENFKIGKQLHDDRRVLASNLFNAIQRLGAAYAYSKTCMPKPDVFRQASGLLHEARAELDEAYRFYQLEFMKARKLGRTDECLRLVTQIEQLIPDRDDPRHLQARRWRRGLSVDDGKKKRTDSVIP